jgi:hypothetical protein
MPGEAVKPGKVEEKNEERGNEGNESDAEWDGDTEKKVMPGEAVKPGKVEEKNEERGNEGKEC